MTFSFKNHFTTASLALNQGSSIQLDSGEIKPAEHRHYCRWSKRADTAYLKERNAWESLNNSFTTEDWNQAFSPEQLASFQCHLVKQRSALRSRVSGIRLIITWLFYGMLYIRHCKQLTGTMQALSARLNTSQTVVQEVLSELTSKKIDAFIQDFFPEQIRKTVPTEKEFLKASDFYFMKQGSNWQVHYLDPSSGSRTHCSKATAVKLKTLHSQLISTQFLKKACETAPNNSKIKFEYTSELHKRPDIGQRNLVVVNTSGNCFFMDATGQVAQFNIPFSASEEVLKIKWNELVTKVVAERDFEDRSHTYRELLNHFSDDRALKFINRSDQEPADREAFLASHEIRQENVFTDLISSLTIAATAKYTNLRVFYITPHDCALSSKDIPIDTDVEFLKKSLEAIRADHLEQFKFFNQRVRELETNQNIQSEFKLSALNCEVTLAKTIDLSAELKGTVRRTFSGFSVERLNATVKNLTELKQKFGRVPEIFCLAGVKFVLDPAETPANSETIYASYRVIPGSIQIEIHYPLLSLDQPVRQTLSFEDPDSLEKALNKLELIISLEKNFKLKSAALTELSKLSEVEIPPAVPKIMLRKSLTELFKEIVWDISDLNQEGKDYTPERLFLELDNIIVRIEQYLVKGSAEMDRLKAIPDFTTHPEDHKKYFRDLHALLTHIIQGLQNAKNKETTKQILINLCVAGSWCGARWMGEAISCYNQLSNEITQIDKQPLKDQILFWIDQFKSRVVQALTAGAGQNTHTYLRYAAQLSQLGVANFPGARAAMYQDPYRAHSNDEELVSAFRKRCSASEIIIDCFENIQTALLKQPLLGADLSNLFFAAVEPFYVPVEGQPKCVTLDGIIHDQGYWPYKDDNLMERQLTPKGCGLLLSHLGRMSQKV